MIVDLINPSAWHPLRVSSQDRLRTAVIASAPAPATAKRETFADIERRGNATIMKSTRISTKFGSEMREVQTRVYASLGYETLAQYVTEISERDLRLAQQALTVAPRVQQIRDEWAAPKPLKIVPPGGSVTIHLEESARIAINCDEPVTLQISNVSTSRTLRLRVLDIASKEDAHCAWIPPAKEYPTAAIVNCNGTHAAVIELQPT